MGNKRDFKFNKKRVGNSKEENTKWMIKITLLTFGISAILSFISEMLLRNVEVLVAFIILIIIIMVGIIFDIIGVAVTAADETPFHSMSSRKITGAKTSVKLIRNASKVSNICNDAIGDISGIISGAAGAVVIERIMNISSNTDKLALSIALSSIIASITVGGKAFAKHFAITQCNNIVYKIGYIVESIENIFKKPI